MKPRHIKIWPDLTYSTPATLYFKSLIKKDRDVILDFRNCRYVNATGLTILLIRLLKMICQNDVSRTWTIELPQNEDVLHKMESMGFLKILDHYIENKDLFWPNKSLNKTSSIKFRGKNFEQILSLPIHIVNFHVNKERGLILAEFKAWLLERIEKYSTDFKFSVNQFALVFNELVKNSADHTLENICFVGIDFISGSNENDDTKIVFSIGDLGRGILRNVREYLFKIGQARAEYLSIDEMYRWALQYGNTTQIESPYNAGIGMPTVVAGAKPINLELFVFDAESGGYLSNIESLSYSNIRRNFYHLGHDVGFYYFGEIMVKR